MKTRQNIRRIAIGTIQKFMTTVLFLIVLTNCSKDDGAAESAIKAQKTTVSIEGVNNCSTSIGDGTILSLLTPYTAADGLVISKIRLKATVSNGESNESTTTNFTDSGSTIALDGCFTFGSQDWVEYEVRLEANDGSLSNTSTVRVNKPNGAN